MALRKKNTKRSYGIGGGFVNVFPSPIVAQRAPTANDSAEVGQVWVNQASDAIYQFVRTAAGQAVWATSPASGSTTLASLVVTGTSNLQGAVTLDSTLNVTGPTTVNDFSVAGSFSLNTASQFHIITSANQADAILLSATAGGIDIFAAGPYDLDIASAGGLNLTSLENAPAAVQISANGGTSESVLISSTQGTGLESVEISSAVGGILVASGLAGPDAILIEAPAGAVKIEAATQAALTSAQNAADAVFLNATAGGINIYAAGTAGEDIDIKATGSSVNITSTENTSDAIVLLATVGGIDITATGGPGEDIDMANITGSINLSSGENVEDSIDITSAGGINVTANGPHNIDITAAADMNINANSINLISSENVVNSIVLSAANGGIDIVTNSTEDIDITSFGGGINLLSRENNTGAVSIEANGGVNESIFIHTLQGTTAQSILLQSDLGGIELDAQGLIYLDANGKIHLETDVDAIDAVLIEADGGTSDTIRIYNSQGSAANAIFLEAGSGGVLAEAGLDAASAIYLHANGGVSESIRLHADQGTGASSIELTSDAGSIDVNAGVGVTVDAVSASNFTVSGAGDLTLAAQTSSVNVTGAEAVADAVLVSATNAAGGITLDAGATPGVTVTNGTQSFQILTGSGSPNGAVTAAQGSLYVDVAGATSTTILFVNTDGAMAWVGVGV